MRTQKILRDVLYKSKFLFRSYTGTRVVQSKPSGESSLSGVTGLSNKVIAPNNSPVGPGASKSSNYKNPEYFLYNKTSFFEAEIEMAKYRCPQPSNKVKYQPNQ